MAATLIVIFWVTENFEKKGEKPEKTGFVDDFKQIVARKPIASLILSAAIVRTAMIGTLPLIPLYVQLLAPSQDNVVLFAGMATAAMGIANMIAAPQLGKLGDKC